MIPKKSRLFTDEVRRVFDGPEEVSSSDFFKTLIVFKDSGRARFAVVVPKKTSPKAVKRNALRRRAFSALSGFYTKTRPGLYVIIVKDRVIKLDALKISEELQKLLISKKR